MTTSHIDIKIGSLGNSKQIDTEEIQIDFTLHKQKIEKINKKICQITGQDNAPFLFVEFPSIDLTQFIPKKQTKKEELYQFNHFVKDSKHFYCGNFKYAQMKKFTKNLQKAFIKLNELDTQAKFSISLSSQKKTKQNLWANATIKGEAKIDNKFVPLLKQLLQKVSPKFIDSPIVILLQQLQSIDLNLNIKTFELPQFVEEIIKKYFEIDLLKDQKLIKKLRDSKEQIVIRLTLGHLFSLKIKGSAFLTLLKFL